MENRITALDANNRTKESDVVFISMLNDCFDWIKAACDKGLFHTEFPPTYAFITAATAQRVKEYLISLGYVIDGPDYGIIHWNDK